jgi:hypothetical protein
MLIILKLFRSIVLKLLKINKKSGIKFNKWKKYIKIEVLILKKKEILLNKIYLNNSQELFIIINIWEINEFKLKLDSF